MAKNEDFATWMQRQYLIWQMNEGGLRKTGDFAEYLGISQPTLSGYMNGARTPRRETVDLLAKRLGPAVYDALGLARPDPNLEFVVSAWDYLAEEDRSEILHYVTHALWRQPDVAYRYQRDRSEQMAEKQRKLFEAGRETNDEK